MTMKVYTLLPNLLDKLREIYPAILFCQDLTQVSKNDILITSENELLQFSSSEQNYPWIVLYSPDLTEDDLSKYLIFPKLQYLSTLEYLDQSINTLLDNRNISDVWIGKIEKKVELSLDKKQVQVLKKGASSRWSFLQSFFEQFNYSDYFTHIEDNLLMIGEELLSNLALHSPEKNAQLSLALGEKGLTLTFFQDCGPISISLVKSSLSRAFKLKEVNLESRGAGLGLYLTYKNCNALFIKYNEEHNISITAYIKKNKRYKEFRKERASLYFIQQKYY